MVAANYDGVLRCVFPDREDQDHPKGVSVDSEEVSAWRTALSMFSGSYSGLAIQERVHRKRKKSVIASKISSSGKAEPYVIPLVIEQLRGLANSSVLVRNVRSGAC